VDRPWKADLTGRVHCSASVFDPSVTVVVRQARFTAERICMIMA
jgi:hypothetical protein